MRVRILTRDQLAANKASRGCPTHCPCTPCCDDLYRAEVTELGFDPYDVDPEMLRSRLLMAARTRRTQRPAGSAPAGVRAGRPAKRRPQPSPKQTELIERLFAERDLGGPVRAQALALRTYSPDFGPGKASELIDYLLDQPRIKTPHQRRQEAELEEGALYAWVPGNDRPEQQAEVEGSEVEIYRVQRSKSSGRLYALRVLEGGGTDYAPGMVARLDPQRKLSLEEAKAWGRRTGTCCNCYARLTNPASVKEGIGPVCAGRV